jgi:hypothetical protein
MRREETSTWCKPSYITCFVWSFKSVMAKWDSEMWYESIIRGWSCHTSFGLLHSFLDPWGWPNCILHRPAGVCDRHHKSHHLIHQMRTFSNVMHPFVGQFFQHWPPFLQFPWLSRNNGIFASEPSLKFPFNLLISWFIYLFFAQRQFPWVFKTIEFHWRRFTQISKSGSGIIREIGYRSLCQLWGDVR